MRKLLADNHIAGIGQDVRPAIYKFQIREQFKEMPVCRNNLGLQNPLIRKGQIIHQRQSACHLHFRSRRFDGIRESVSESQLVRMAVLHHRKSIDVPPVRILVLDLELLYHIRADDNHERQAHRQPHRLYGGV